VILREKKRDSKFLHFSIEVGRRGKKRKKRKEEKENKIII